MPDARFMVFLDRAFNPQEPSVRRLSRTLRSQLKWERGAREKERRVREANQRHADLIERCPEFRDHCWGDASPGQLRLFR